MRTNQVKSITDFFKLSHQQSWVKSGGTMDFLSNLGNVNWEPLLQLAFVALIGLSGPVVILLLAARGGDL